MKFCLPAATIAHTNDCHRVDPGKKVETSSACLSELELLLREGRPLGLTKGEENTPKGRTEGD